eukprot:SAG11_NODE_5738_length_1474_cov_1.432000_2_plen_153_part_00
MISFVLLNWVMNCIAFSQFWIPIDDGNMDRSGVALTVMLTSAFIQYEAKIAKESTWLDQFFSISVAFHIAAFLASIVVSIENRAIEAHGGDEKNVAALLDAAAQQGRFKQVWIVWTTTVSLQSHYHSQNVVQYSLCVATQMFFALFGGEEIP